MTSSRTSPGSPYSGGSSQTPQDLERQRAALYAVRGGKPPQTVDSFFAAHPEIDREKMLRLDGYIDLNERPWHPDPITEALRKDACEGEIQQAIGRGRPLRASCGRANNEPLRVLLVTNIQIEGLPIARRVRWSDLLRNGRVGNKGDEYVWSCIDQFGAAPMSPVAAHELRPDLFTSVAMAKERLAGYANTELVTVKYGTAKQKRWSRALAEHGGEAAAGISLALGCDIILE